MQTDIPAEMFELLECLPNHNFDFEYWWRRVDSELADRKPVELWLEGIAHQKQVRERALKLLSRPPLEFFCEGCRSQETFLLPNWKWKCSDCGHITFGVLSNGLY